MKSTTTGALWSAVRAWCAASREREADDWLDETITICNGCACWCIRILSLFCLEAYSLYKAMP
jgi:hypothetical protein